MSAITMSKAFFLSKALQPQTLAKTISLALATSISTTSLAAEVYIDIPSQALGSALKELGQQTGISVLYSPEDVKNLQSAGVQGRYTAEQALGQILAETGVSFVLQDEAYLLVTHDTPSDVSLGPVRTSGQKSSLSHDSTVTENSGSYTTSAMSVATKLPTSLKKTPRSISIISSQQLKDQGLQNKNIEEVLRYTPGITIDDDTGSTYSSDSTIPSIYSRGQRVTNFQIDGINYDLNGSNPSISNADAMYNSRAYGILTLPDMILYDHVEVLRGPNSVFSGNGTPSATVNMVKKRPLAYRQLQIEGNTASWDSNFSVANYRTTLDFTSPLPILDERIRTRFIISRQDGAASFQDHHKSERQSYYGVVDFDLSNKTLLGISYSKENNDTTGTPISGGLPRYHWGGNIGLPVRTNLTTKHTYNDTDSDTLQIYAKHNFNDNWQIDVNTAHLEQKLKNFSNYIWASNIYEDYSGGKIWPATAHNRKSISQDSFDIRTTGSFKFLDRKISILAGVDSKKLSGKNHIYDFILHDKSYYEIENIINYDQNQYKLSSSIIWNPHIYRDIQEELGFYGSTKINLTDPINIIITGRKARYKNESHRYNFYSAAINNSYTHKTGTISQPITPTYSITYDINKNLTSYFSYSESYQDQSTFRKGTQTDPTNTSSYIAGGQIDPETGKNYELGINGEFFNGRINTYAVAYYMQRVDIHNYSGFGRTSQGTLPELDNTVCCFNNSGRQESKGIDIGVSGEIYPGLQMNAGYTYNKNKTTSEFSGWITAEKGSKTHTRTPEHQFKFFSTYQFKENLKDWRIGLGAIIHSSAFASGSAAEYLGYDENYVWTDSNGNPTGYKGQHVWSNDSYYANGTNGGFNSGNIYTLPYNFTQGGYAVWNGMIEYTPTNYLTLTLNGNNLFDRRYYRTIGTSTSSNYYGEPRNFSLTARATF